jgi:hypothetical protein
VQGEGLGLTEGHIWVLRLQGRQDRGTCRQAAGAAGGEAECERALFGGMRCQVGAQDK